MERTNTLCQKIVKFWTSYWRLALVFIIVGVIVNVTSVSVFFSGLNRQIRDQRFYGFTFIKKTPVLIFLFYKVNCKFIFNPVERQRIV